MIVFIKNYNLENIRNKLAILYFLNITDMICTLLLLNSGFFIEINPFMIKVVQNLSTSFILKIVLPAVLLLYLSLRISRATDSQLKISNIIINIATITYAFINISHLVWFSFLGVLIVL